MDKHSIKLFHKANAFCSKKLTKAVKKGELKQARCWYELLERGVKDLGELLDQLETEVEQK